MLVKDVVRYVRSAERGQGVEGVQSPRFQKEEAFADAFEEVGLVFDEQDGFARRAKIGQTFGDVFAVLWANAGHGLVEQKQVRVERSAAGECEEFLFPVR